jgi:hypothetical protein
MPEIDIVESRYIDKLLLNQLLTDFFGAGNFEVEVRAKFAKLLYT